MRWGSTICAGSTCGSEVAGGLSTCQAACGRSSWRRRGRAGRLSHRARGGHGGRGEPGIEGIGRSLIAIRRRMSASIPAQKMAMSTLASCLARPAAVNCVRSEQLELLQGGMRPPSRPLHRGFSRILETVDQLTLDGDEQWAGKPLDGTFDSGFDSTKVGTQCFSQRVCGENFV